MHKQLLIVKTGHNRKLCVKWGSTNTNWLIMLKSSAHTSSVKLKHNEHMGMGEAFITKMGGGFIA